MASRRQRRKRQIRKQTPAPAAEQTADPKAPDAADEKTPAPAGPPRHRTRFGVWADRLEETADERPPAPWGTFPLGPIAVFAGLVLIVIGAIGGNAVQLAIGVVLGSLGGLELAIREHFSGFRSHTTLLAGFIFVIVVGLTYYVATVVLWACLLIGVTIALPAFWLLRKKFEKASGGLTYKLR